jgi:hypothetical protein
MKYEWYVARFKNGNFFDNAPHAMSRTEADNLLSLAQLTDKGFSYKVMHKNDLKKLKDKQ